MSADRAGSTTESRAEPASVAPFATPELSSLRRACGPSGRRAKQSVNDPPKWIQGQVRWQTRACDRTVDWLVLALAAGVRADGDVGQAVEVGPKSPVMLAAGRSPHRFQ
ncbi:MAG TPA: hypothetical protein VND64_01020, partial [Pirellulales bacterium]|nr:hypothetical protein [Pirellulales bacterium]